MPEWTARAACRGADPDLFFPVGWTQAAASLATVVIREYCSGCPVSAECFAWGEQFPADDGGIWGGRRRVAGELRPAFPPCGSTTSYYRHKRLDEDIDDACQAAYRAQLEANRIRRRRTPTQERVSA